MASTVSNGNDRSAMATTVLRNGIDRFKWQRPYTKGKFATPSTAHKYILTETNSKGRKKK